MRVHLGGRQVGLLNSAVAQAARNPGTAPTVIDDSVDGSDPDPDADGNPNNNASPTPVPTQLPGLSIVKTAGLPRRVADDVFEIDYLLSVINKGQASAPNVRVIDNLECIVQGGQAASNIASWQLVGTPVARKGCSGSHPRSPARRRATPRRRRRSMRRRARRWPACSA